LALTMASKFAVVYGIPNEFPEVLKAFTREVLRVKPANINDFAVKYFERKAQGLPEDEGGGAEQKIDSDDVEMIVRELFTRYDTDNNLFLDPREFKNLMSDLQARMGFPPDEVYRFLAEADMNADGQIEYEEFIPLALQIVQSIYAKKVVETHASEVTSTAQNLVHGMSRDELTRCIDTMFQEMDTDNTGVLSRAAFVQALQAMELGLTRRELNAVMFQVDVDQDGFVSYREFTRFAFELLQKLTSMRLLESEMESDQFAQYLADLLRSRDLEGTGVLKIEDLKDLLHEANLGLSRLQIYSVLSEATVDDTGMVQYLTFIPRATGVIRAMLSFQQNIEQVDDDAEIIASLEAGLSALPSPCPVQQLVQCLESLGLAPREVAAVVNAAQESARGAGAGTVDPRSIISDVWRIVKTVRTHASAF
jgi:Ca2+-binding EF-hand superfamily protein